jgi:1-acyl-sn-glycerol-3-phosphate acyltransferase
MWLQPVVKLIANAAARGYYRLDVSGPPVPKKGPVLLVANHPNALLDPALVVASANRRVRFLAKSTLFTDPRLGWLVRGGGAIPVFRRMDDPGKVAQNEDMFRAAFEALGEGSTVGIFPEGTSHSEPSLGELKTGAARIALGAFERRGEAFPIVPIGLTLRQKERFRSRALALLGEPVEWSDLGPRGVEDREAVRELTTRIGASLRKVTVNLETWQDAPLVEWTEAIWAAEHRAYEDRGEQVATIATISTILASLRRGHEGAGEAAAEAALGARQVDVPELAAEILEHRDRLRALRLEPRDLSDQGPSRPRLRYRFLDPFSVVIDTIGYLLFWIPYKLTGRVAGLARPEPETLSTYRLLIGVIVYTLWVAGLAAIAGRFGGPLAAALAFAGVPLLGLIGLKVRERRLGQRRQWQKVSRVLPRRDRIPFLRARQGEIAGKLDELWQAWQRGEISASMALDEPA